jgi:transcriptional regulator with XRE-family HTH domain
MWGSPSVRSLNALRAASRRTSMLVRASQTPRTAIRTLYRFSHGTVVPAVDEAPKGAAQGRSCSARGVLAPGIGATRTGWSGAKAWPIASGASVSTGRQAGLTGPASQDAAMPRGGPAVLRMLLGAQLCRLRQARGITPEHAGDQIQASRSKITRLERGRAGLTEHDIADLLALYGASEQQRAALLALARHATAPPWWAGYGEVVASWFEYYLGLEHAASQIRAYELQFVPGLLQTADYARAVTLLGHRGAPGEQVELRVRLRLARQELLAGPDPPALQAVVDEAALRRPLGGPQVMRAQLEHLIQITELPNIVVQIMPFRRGGHPAAGGAFTILRSAEADLPDVVYLEQLTSALYLSEHADTFKYLQVVDRLSAQAEPPEATASILTQILKAF